MFVCYCNSKQRYVQRQHSRHLYVWFIELPWQYRKLHRNGLFDDYEWARMQKVSLGTECAIQIGLSSTPHPSRTEEPSK